MCTRFFLILAKSECLASERGVFLVEGQIEPLDEARADLARIDLQGITVDHAAGDGDQTPSLPLLDHLSVAELWCMEPLWIARSSPPSRARIRDIDVPALQQCHLVLHKTVDDKQRQRTASFKIAQK